ncbi:MAG: 50S ribosomal protein L11 methyltransferase [bacterium]|nr:50S ribosomal protein L11 methyltransferase [bacterium]
MTRPDDARAEPAWMAVIVECAEPAADAVASLLLDEGAPGVMTGESGVDAPPATPGCARLEAHVPESGAARLAAVVRTYLDSLATLDPAWSGGTVRLAPVPAVDWDAVFRAHHRPLAIGARLLVAPPWDVPDAPGREVLVVEPGMAFGTGQHATTRTCLEEIEDAVAAGGVASALDVGTGSGILAAALARLGVPRVVALDDDAGVLTLARATLVRNHAARVRLFGGRPAALRGRFDLVVANLLADVLVGEAPVLAAVTAPCGRLVVSGILAEQVDRVAAAYPGFTLRHVRADDPWRTLRLERPA